MRQVLLVSTLVLLAGLIAQAQRRQQIDLSRLGPQVGERVPDFSLVDQSGVERTLQSLMGSRGLMLVFIRSADW
jgi:hypothetical protein